MSSTSAPIPVRTVRRPARLGASLQARPALAVALITLLSVFVALVATHRSPRLAVPKSVALQHALADRGSGALLARLHWTHFDVVAVDSRYEVLDFYRGPVAVGLVGVGFNGRVVIAYEGRAPTGRSGYGSNIGNDPRVLIGLCVVFALMAGVWPLWRIRNLDVMVAASFAASVLLFNRGMYARMTYVSYPALLYLACRCAWWALGAPRSRPACSLYERLTRSWSAAARLRILRLGAVACALIVAMVALTSLHVLDVAYAVMEGGTAIIHGVSPYSHFGGDVLHGNTYPIGSYLLYAPFAALSPVRSQWDNADLALGVAVGAVLLTAWGLARIRRGVGLRAGGRNHDGEVLGLRTAIAWMTFPPLLVTVSTGTSDVVLGALLVGALVLWRRPAAGTAMLSCAAWLKAVPAVLLPLWLAAHRGTALARACVACVLVSAAMVGAVLALGGLGGPGQMIHDMGFQLSRQSPQTLWNFLGSVPLQQLAQAATLALLAGGMVRVWRDRDLARDRARFSGLCAAVLLGVQISGNYWTFMYLAWVLPFLVLSLLSGDGSVFFGKDGKPGASAVQSRLDTLNFAAAPADVFAANGTRSQ